MPLKALKEVPATSAWTPLSDHQAVTPASFSTPVLHQQSLNTKIVLASDQKTLLPAFFPDETEPINETNGHVSGANGTVNAHDEAEDDDNEEVDEDYPPVEDVTLENVDIYVVSNKFIIWSHTKSAGYELTYPQITIHAITTSTATGDAGIYMQIDASENSFDDYEDNSLEITIYPSVTTTDETATETHTQILYKALTTCSNLHPDPKPAWGIDQENVDDLDDNEDKIYFEDNPDFIQFTGGADEVGGIPALAPGGWITADNLNSIQWNIGGQTGTGDPNNVTPLGPGAGTVREREDEESKTADAEETDESKWRRTD